MRYSISTLVVSVLALFAPSNVKANTPLGDAFVQNDMTFNRGYEIAWASRPMWHFGISGGNYPCYPSPALINGQQHGTNPDYWPRAGTGCANPGPPGGRGNPFPTYYTVNYCGADELRVVYSIYTTHDGFRAAIIARGHMHDWERVIVIWRRENGQWTRRELLKSYHSGYMHDAWGSVQNTINYDNINEQDGKNKDGAKIYVGWGKHAMFSQRNTGWNDEPSQGCGREFRSRDWWYIPERNDLVCAGAGCSAGDEMARFDWGSATSGPWVMESRVCSESEGGYVACREQN